LSSNKGAKGKNNTLGKNIWGPPGGTNEKKRRITKATE